MTATCPRFAARLKGESHENVAQKDFPGAFSRIVNSANGSNSSHPTSLIGHSTVSGTPQLIGASQHAKRSSSLTSPSGSNLNSPDPVPPSASTPPIDDNAGICQKIFSIRKCQSAELLLLDRLELLAGDRGDASRLVCAELLTACQQKLSLLNALNKEINPSAGAVFSTPTKGGFLTSPAKCTIETAALPLGIEITRQPNATAIANKYMCPAPAVRIRNWIESGSHHDSLYEYVVDVSVAYSNGSSIEADAIRIRDQKQELLQGITEVAVGEDGSARLPKLKLTEVSSKHLAPFVLVFSLVKYKRDPSLLFSKYRFGGGNGFVHPAPLSRSLSSLAAPRDRSSGVSVCESVRSIPIVVHSRALTGSKKRVYDGESPSGSLSSLLPLQQQPISNAALSSSASSLGDLMRSGDEEAEGSSEKDNDDSDQSPATKPPANSLSAVSLLVLPSLPSSPPPPPPPSAPPFAPSSASSSAAASTAVIAPLFQFSTPVAALLKSVTMPVLSTATSSTTATSSSSSSTSPPPSQRRKQTAKSHSASSIEGGVSSSLLSASSAPSSSSSAPIDITNLLVLPQKEAARFLGLSESMLCKRFKEATKRKWPFRYLRKIERFIYTIQKQHEPGSGAQMTQETADRLSQLQAERALCLQPVKIRISPGDRNAPESNASGENNDQQEANGKKRSADTLSGRRKEIDLQTESASCCDSFVGDTDDNDALRTLALLSKQFKTP